MKSQPIKLNANKLAKDITVKIELTGLRVWQVRLFFGMLLFRVAGFMIGCNITTEIKDNKKDCPNWRDFVRDNIIPEINDTDANTGS